METNHQKLCVTHRSTNKWILLAYSKLYMKELKKILKIVLFKIESIVYN